jgi:hypothetical protein
MAKTHFVRSARKAAGKCEKCFMWIAAGDPYKWISVRLRGQSEPGQKRIRCEGCEDWHEWEWSPSLSAQCKRVIHDTEETLRWHRTYEDEHGALAIMGEAMQQARIFSNTRSVSADRARYVFGNSNFKTKQFDQEAAELMKWADRIGSWRCPPLPEPELTDCSLCSAKGMDTEAGGDSNCLECGGAGQYVPETPGDEQLDEWRHIVADSAMEVLDTCPI